MIFGMAVMGTVSFAYTESQGDDSNWFDRPVSVSIWKEYN